MRAVFCQIFVILSANVWISVSTTGNYGHWIYSERSGDFVDCQDGSYHLTKRGDEVCMDELGCFRLTDDFYHPQFRPCNVLPQPRGVINTRFILFTKDNTKQGKFLVANNVTSLNSSGIDRNRPTKVIIHGLQENPLHDPWILIMMKTILENNDCNVVIVDWSRGSYTSYIQAAANTRVVGAELAVLVEALQRNINVSSNSIHFIGHGLGAHIAGYAAERMNEKPSRITGLDPSYKFFCNMPESVRLDSGDAAFVDIIHTELHGYDSGHGGCHEIGHVDFFPNGGGDHPGCHNLWGSAAATHKLYSGYRGVSTCERQRAVSLFISTIKSESCQMIGYWCRSYKAFLRGECADCGDEGSRCAVMGYRADEYAPYKDSNFSTMYLVTGRFPPFCVYEYRLRMVLNASRLQDNYTPSGSLVVALKGQQKPLFVHLSFYSLHHGREYTFLVTSPVNIGDVRNVTVKWEEYGVYEESWGYGQEVFYLKSSSAHADKIYITLLNDIGTNGRNRSPSEKEFCRSNSSRRIRNGGWMTYMPNC